MKRISRGVTIFLLLVTAIFPLRGQDGKRWQVDFGLSNSTFDRYPALSGVISSELHKYELYKGERDKGENYPHPILLPSISLCCGFVDEDGMGFFLNTFWNYGHRRLYGGPSVMKEKESIVRVFAETRYYYIDKRKVRLYSGVGLGLKYRRYTEEFMDDIVSKNEFGLTFQLCPIGIALGEKIQFSIDTGLGAAFCPLRFSVGFRL